MHQDQQRQPQSKVYLLSLWRENETSPWRASLRQADQDNRLAFPDLEKLALYLLNLPDGTVVSAEEGSVGA